MRSVREKFPAPYLSFQVLAAAGCPAGDSPTEQRRPESLAKITLSSTGVRGLARHGGQGRKTEGRGVRVGSFAGQMTYTTFWLPVPEKGQTSGGGDGNHFFRIIPFSLESGQAGGSTW